MQRGLGVRLCRALARWCSYRLQWRMRGGQPRGVQGGCLLDMGVGCRHHCRLSLVSGL